MLWSRVSNAADKSNKIRIDTSCMWKLSNKSLLTRSSAVSVLWNALYADWNVTLIKLTGRWEASLIATIRSHSLEINYRLDTERKIYITICFHCLHVINNIVYIPTIYIHTYKTTATASLVGHFNYFPNSRSDAVAQLNFSHYQVSEKQTVEKWWVTLQVYACSLRSWRWRHISREVFIIHSDIFWRVLLFLFFTFSPASK